MGIITRLLNLFKRRQYASAKESCNIVNSMAKCKALHKKLTILAHPDRNASKAEIAHNITSLLNENRFNYQKLLELEQQIKNELL